MDRLRRSPVVVVTGPRQTGKSTLVRSFAGADLRTYETLDALTTLDRALREPEALVDRKGPLTLDEVQRAPSLLLAIKRAVDEQRTPGRFLLTGSANLDVHKGASDSLAGRAVHLVLRPMTEREKRGKAQSPSPWSGLVRAPSRAAALEVLAERPERLDWRSAALEGGLPPAALEKDPESRAIWFDGYVDTYVQRDLRDLAQVADLGAFLRFTRLCALRTGGLVNHADLARDAAVSAPTAKRWLGLLESTFLVHLVGAFAETRTKRLIKAPKLYFGDVGLALHLAGIHDGSTLDAEPNLGAWLECLVANDLLTYRETEPVKPALHHYRTASNQEVDFVLEHGRRLLPIEVKATRHPRVDDARGIEAFCEELGPRAPFGVLLHDGKEAMALSRRCIAAPLGAVL